MRPERILLFVVAGIVLLAVVAGVVAALRPAPDFEAGTPEAAVQGFLQSVRDGDEEAAVVHLASDSPCDASDIDSARTEGRILLGSSETEDGTARVTVEIVTSSDGGPFDVDEYSREESYELVREDGRWRLSDVPWPLFGCREGNG